jgi:hypothetical protein
MALFFNLKRSKPKPFPYQPMYYDERKERLEKMRLRAEAEKRGVPVDTALEKGFLREQRENSRLLHRNTLRAASLWRVVRLLVILAAILVLMYFISPEMFKLFWMSQQ